MLTRIYKVASLPFDVALCVIARLISALVPRDPGTIVFIPRLDGNFEGNLKYLLLYMRDNPEAQGLGLWWMTSDRRVANMLKEAGIQVAMHRGLRSHWILLRASIVVVDSGEWVGKQRAALAASARIVQLWHGSGLKTVALLNQETKKKIWNNPALRLLSRIRGIIPVYDTVCFATEFQLQARSKAFRYRCRLVTQQPRNDVLRGDVFRDAHLGADVPVLNTVVQWKSIPTRSVVLLAPTHPPSGEPSMLSLIDVSLLNRHLKSNGVLLVVKRHPKDDAVIEALENCMEYDRTKDVYPLLPLVDALVTDFSSIYTDFLTLRRPTVFFTGNLKRYESKRTLVHDHAAMAPGPACVDLASLIEALGMSQEEYEDAYGDDVSRVIRELSGELDLSGCETVFQHLRDTYGLCSH